MAGSARASTLDFTGTLELRVGDLPSVTGPGSGTAGVSVTGVNHLASLALPGGAFGV